MTVVWIIVSAGLLGLVGGITEGDEGFFVGAIFGALLGLYVGLRAKLSALERRLSETDNALAILVAANRADPPVQRAKPAFTQDDERREDQVASPLAMAQHPDSLAVVQSVGPEEAEHPSIVADVADDSLDGDATPPIDPWQELDHDSLTKPPGSALLDAAWAKLSTFFTSGNVVVKVGLIILFFGISFLIKYAHERHMLPIEFRLSAIASFGIGLLLFGWHVRARKASYAMTLQGGAIGILFLTVFAAARHYHLVPMGFAFALMGGLVLLAAVLAIAQNAVALAVFGSVGGFLAPVLTSTGEGSHVALFSYYALLNLGIFGIAWFKSWRQLNWVGFIFTFVIASLWGNRYYTPQYFDSTEPFLILFGLFYVAITVLFATRQAPRLRGLVDGSLVFGVPTAAFALQSQLVKGVEYGLAYSALALGSFYLALTFFLWRRFNDEMKLLVDSFLALGVIFLSLCVSFALDGYWTAAAWSLEGAGLIWVGLRQAEIFPRILGTLLQIGAALFFVTHSADQTTSPALLNSAFVGSFLIAIGGLLSAFAIMRHRASIFNFEEQLESLFLGWGLVWWFWAGTSQIGLHVEHQNEQSVWLIFVALSALALGTAGRHLDWQRVSIPGLALSTILVGVGAISFLDKPELSPLRNLGIVAWPIAIGTNYLILARYAQRWGEKIRSYSHTSLLLLTTFLSTWAFANWLDSAHLGDAWVLSSTAVLPCMVILFLSRFGTQLGWPVRAFEDAYRHVGLIPLVGYLVLWQLFSVLHAGDFAPLDYLPVLNPLELTGVLCLMAMTTWYLARRDAGRELSGRYFVPLTGTLCFLWFNTVLFRATHYLTNVPYDFDLLWRSASLQSTLSIAWTLLGSVLMVAAGLWLKRRDVWIVGAALLGFAVAKLFIVDLADIGTVSRIISFIGVGLILLVIGYFAPLPPKIEEQCQ